MHVVNVRTVGFQFHLIYESPIAQTFPLLIFKTILNLYLKVNVFSLKYVLLLYI